MQSSLAALTVRLDRLEGLVAKYINDPPSDKRKRPPFSSIVSASQASHKALEVPMAATRVVTTHMVTPAESNGAGVCMGGIILSWIDVAAGLAAKTLARRPCVTASVDAVHFLRPCRVGAVVIVAAMVNRTFTSSMEVGVRVEEECVTTGARHHCCSAYLTFVAIRPENGEAKLPRVFPGSSRRYQTIFEDAEERRQRRLVARERLRTDGKAAAIEAACRLLPLTHQVGPPTLPPALKSSEVTRASRRIRISPALTTAHQTHIIMPQHANSIGITFGGQVLQWVEQAAFVVAARASRGSHLLTAGMDGVTFAKATRVGYTFYVEAQATAIFGSSAEVMVSLWGEVPEEGKPFHCGDAFVTVVSVDADGAPVDSAFELVPETEEEKIRYSGAVARRAGRLTVRQQLLKSRNKRTSLDEDAHDGVEEGGGKRTQNSPLEEGPLAAALAYA